MQPNVYQQSTPGHARYNAKDPHTSVRGAAAGGPMALLGLAMLAVVSLLIILVVRGGVSYRQLKDNATVTTVNGLASTPGCTCGTAGTVTTQDLTDAIKGLGLRLCPQRRRRVGEGV